MNTYVWCLVATMSYTPIGGWQIEYVWQPFLSEIAR